MGPMGPDSNAKWMAEAGIEKVGRDCYRGHSATDVASRYEWHWVGEHLVADAERIRAAVFVSSGKKVPRQAGKAAG